MERGVLLDFDLGKDDQNKQIIVRLKESFSTQWKTFRESDRPLSFHGRLKLLPPSEKNYVNQRKVRDKFVKRKVANFYYNFETKKLFYIDYVLPDWAPPIPKPKSSQQDNRLKKLCKLKFDPAHHDVLYFIDVFKTLTEGYSPLFKKFSLESILPRSLICLIPQFQTVPIDEIYEILLLKFFGKSHLYVQQLSNLKIEETNLIQSVTQHFVLLDLIYFNVSEKRKIEFIIGKMPDSLKAALCCSTIPRQVFYLRRKFKQFLTSYAKANLQ